jgi:AcrR family transcriptional regulator
VSTTNHQRREPSQKRSRETVRRILGAAMELIEEGGVDAATTRAIAERAGVSVPSLYRFFADRNEILDRLVEHHIEGLDAHVAAQPPQVPGSLGEAMLIAMEAYASYWDENPGAARLWFEGRASPNVLREVHAQNRKRADETYAAFVAMGVLPPGTDPLVTYMAFELGDRVLDMAFRNGAPADRATIAEGARALTAYVELSIPQPVG